MLPLMQRAVRPIGRVGKLMQSNASHRFVTSLSKTDASGVAIIQMDNGPLNKLSLDLLTSLTANIKQAEATTSTRAIILASSSRVFSAGLDLEMLVRLLYGCIFGCIYKYRWLYCIYGCIIYIIYCTPLTLFSVRDSSAGKPR
jgi:hypothetical protein